MPSLDDEAVEKLVEGVVTRVVSQTRADAERSQRLAVERAVRDANVDRDLRDHEAHFARINGSQEAMASSLKEVQKTLESLASTFRLQVQVQEALTTSVQSQHDRGLKRWQVVSAALATIAAYGSIIAILISHA